MPRVVKFFSKHGHVAFQIDGDDKQNRIQLPCQFQRLYQTLCVFSHITEKILNRIFILLQGSCPRGRTWGAGVKNFSVGICDGAPSTAHSSCTFRHAMFKVQCTTTFEISILWCNTRVSTSFFTKTIKFHSFICHCYEKILHRVFFSCK